MRYVTEDIASFVARVKTPHIPEPVLEHAAKMVLDVLASAAGGFPTGLAQTARASARSLFGQGSHAIWYSDARSTALGAAFANSAATTALDIDDGHRGACGHAGGAIVPAVLSLAEGRGWLGRDILGAIVIGYDIALRVATARRPEKIDNYNSGPWVGFGVAAAIGWLEKLSAAQIVQAMAIAGAEAPGSLPTGASKRMGSTVKEGIPWGMLTALAAVERARHGGTGPEDLLDRADVYDRDVLLGGLGSDWFITTTYLKPYACCRYVHAAIDAIAELRRDGGEVRGLTVEVFPNGLDLNNDREPATLEAAQYSFPFSTALAVLRGVESLQPMQPQMLHDPEVLALSRRMELRAADDFATAFPQRTPARVTIDYAEESLTKTVDYARGDVANPMSKAEVEAKFTRLSAGLLPARRQDEIRMSADALLWGQTAPLLSALALPVVETQAA